MTCAESARVAMLNVSRETSEALGVLETLVRRWNPAVNLVSKASLQHLYKRHVLDSVQLYGHLPESAGVWVDLGSGGGFPGLVIAILAREKSRDLLVTMVESDGRKATFLRQAALALDLQVTVINDRIEKISPLGADVLSARALAPLPVLLDYAERHLHQDGIAIFPKGGKHMGELTAARQVWNFKVEAHPSLSEQGSAILVIRDIERARQD